MEDVRHSERLGARGLLAAVWADWKLRVIALTAVALIVRLVVIAVTDGGADLAIYRFFGGFALHGVNPYDAPAGGPIEPRFADSPPLEFALFAGLLALHDSAATLRIFFALCDAGTLLLIGFAFPFARAWRWRVLVFYAFNPFVLTGWTAFAEDKTLLFLLIAALLLALDGGRLAWAWAATAALTALKFLGAFFAPALALHTVRALGWRRALIPVGLCAAAVALTCLLWFPDSLHMLDNRRDRAAIPEPIHASPLLFLSHAGLYATWLPQLLMIVSLIVVIALYARERLDVKEAVVLSIAAGYVYLPDQPSNRILLVLLPFLLLVDLSRRAWILLWIASLPAAAAVIEASRPLPGGLAQLIGPSGSLRQVVWLHLPLLVVFASWIRERSRAAPISVSVSK
ncbi:hypothetical protein [Conexibacter sp. CPCC 206217]|uniref:hypothetical protein n=1 Tax=Conexibacter sp. CPCC 206217 TaxID=3064574 RepID=UPI00271E4758|nr:hypothetical protein [Conexibacter sp. CPCC 206217]MDO8210054.1 hypothetical protein [Conexibacter sp. CPCC 206217]